MTMDRIETKDKEQKKSILSVFKFRRHKTIRETSCHSESDTAHESLIPFVQELEDSRCGLDKQANSDAKQMLKQELERPLNSRSKAATLEDTRVKTKKGAPEKKVGRWQQLRTRLQQTMILPNKMNAVPQQESITEKNKYAEISLKMEKFSSATESFSDLPVEELTKTEEKESKFPCPVQTKHSLSKTLQGQKSLSPNWKCSNAFNPPETMPINYLNLTSAEQMQGECTSDSALNSLNSGPVPTVRCRNSLKVNRASSCISKKDCMRLIQVMEAGDVFLQHSASNRSQPSKDKLELRKSAGAVTDVKVNRDRNILQTFLRRHRFSISKSVTTEVEVTDADNLSSVSAINLESVASWNSFHLLGSAENYKIGTSPIANLRACPLPFSPIDKPFLDLRIPPSCDDAALLHKRAASLPDLINSIEKKMEKCPFISKVAGNILTDPGYETTTTKQECNRTVEKSRKKTQNRTRLSSLSEYRAVANTLGSHQCLSLNHSISHCDGEQLTREVIERVVPPDENAGVLRRMRQRTTSVDKSTLSSTIMFGRKSHGDVKKSAQKILDPKKDHVTRLKHLRIVLESYDASDAKVFFEQYYSVIYFLFHEGFTNVETSLGQRANKAHREELDYMLFILEKILTLLPEMIHKRWQLHSIGRIMRKLLHSGNSLKLRREGMRLFLMWYEILMDNATEECHKMFRSLVPKMSPSASSDNFEADFFIGRTFSNTKVTVPDVYPILPSQAGEKQPDNLSKWLLEGLLSYMVSEVSKIQWNNHELHEYCFKFLFDKFKDHYLPEIFPGLNRSNSIYEPCLDLPERTVDGGGTVPTVALCQEAVVKWMTYYTTSPTVQSSGINQNVPEKCDVDMMENGQCMGQDVDRPIPGSNASTLSTASSYMENCSNGSSACSDDHSMFTEQEVVRIVLYSSRENVNIVHEVFRQAFLFPFHHSTMVRRVIHVYRSWFQSDVMPVFMQDKRSSSLSSGTNSAKDIDRRHSTSSVTSGQVNCQLEQASAALMTTEVNHKLDVRAGLQKVLQVFITNSANLFMIESPASIKETTEHLKLEDQVDLCKRVLAIYRYLVTNVDMDRATWEQLLLVLLKITSIIMTISPPVYREKSLSGRLADYLFKTLILAWVKANLHIQVSEQLWKQFLGTLSSLTNWIQLIREWSKTMEMLTRILARYIYAIDLRDLPLDKLSEQKVKRMRGAKNGSVRAKDRTLSRNWIKQVIGGDGNSKLEQQQLQQQPKPSTAAAVASAVSLASFTNGILMGGSNHGMNLVGTRLETMRQRSRSGELSLMCNSQLDISSIYYPPSQPEALVGASSLPRSSSDSSLMIDPNKVKVSGLCISAVESHEVQSAGNRKEDNLKADDDDISPQSHHHSEPSESTGDCHLMSAVTDTTSVTSTDSNLPQYQMIVNRSADSSSSFCMEHSSYSDRSDTEVLLRASDSGSTSSHSIPRSKRRSLNQANDSSVANQVDEEDEEEEEDEDEEEEEENQEQVEGGVSAVGTVEESLDDDDTEDDGTVHSFEERQTKDAQDRDSLRIDDNDTLMDLDVSKSNGKLSILAGGSVTGWTPDVAVVLWHRMLGSLGNINDIKNSDMHAQVYEYLCDLLDTFIKIRENQSVTKDNQRTPPQPTCVPPVLLLAPWLFEALNLPDQFKQGKLLAYQLLCTGTLRRHDVEISADHLHRFYLMLHLGLTHSTQDVTDVLIRYCNAKFFSLPLSGSTLMMLDFIHGAKMVLAQPTDIRNSPRTEAMSFLGSLLCFPNHLKEIYVLEPNSKELTVINCTDLKDHIITILLKFTRKEPTGVSRCIALSCLGIYLYEELCHHETLHLKLKDAFDVLLSALRFNDKSACQVAAHVLTMLSDHMPLLLLKLPEIPTRVVKDMTVTITLLLPATEKGSSEDSKKTASQVLVSVMFTLLEWCMRLPSSLLLTPTAPENRCLLHQVFDVLNMVVNGSSQRTAAPSSQGPLQPMDLPSDDKDIPQTSQSVPSTPMTMVDVNADVPKVQRQDDHLLASASHQKTKGNDADAYGLRLAARTIMLHLINYLYHFPMSASNASQLNSEVQEYHDSTMEEVEPNDLPSQILASSNTQFFVINNMTLMSFVEIPAQVNSGSDGGVTAGLATEKTVCRVIVRDPSGKHCWDSSILYGSQQCRTGSYPKEPPVLLRIDEDEDVSREDRLPSSSQGMTLCTLTNVREHKSSLSTQELPTVSNIPSEEDALDLTLRYLGSTSPECLLHSGEALNAAFHAPLQLSSNVEQQMMDILKQQQLDEGRHVRAHNCDKTMSSMPMKPVDSCDPVSPFHLCRLFFSQMGYMVWEKRKQFDLLQKSEKLLRELKHLDSQRCRETHKIAVIYVGPGQEDKVSILTNAAGSRSFEEFVAALGWQVDLQSHSGFMGGLQRNRMTGSMAPYYATSTKEVIFHVSTQMPSETEEDHLRKLKHLGNDEVHIIWSEHKRDYRHGIIPTEFGDVLIIIYPLENGLFRIQIKRRPEVPFFGPLFDGAIVDFQVLPGLVRATAINAGQMLRSQKPHYQPFYEERMRYIDAIVQKYKMLTMFEMFSSQIFAPGQQSGEESLAPPPASLNNGQPQQLVKVAKATEKNYLSWPAPLGSLRKKMTTDV